MICHLSAVACLCTFCVQSYNFFLTYANKSEVFVRNGEIFGNYSEVRALVAKNFRIVQNAAKLLYQTAISRQFARKITKKCIFYAVFFA